MDDIAIRPAKQEDCQEISRLIKTNSTRVDLFRYGCFTNQLWLRFTNLGFALPAFECNKELNAFENIEGHESTGARELEKDGFGENPFFKCVVAEYTGKDENLLVGYLLYYYIYSTFQGRSAFVGDLFVNPDYRKRGIGTSLWKAASKMVLDAGCSRLDFIVLNCNTNAKKFYDKMGAFSLTDKEDGWNCWTIQKGDLNKIANS